MHTETNRKTGKLFAVCPFLYPSMRHPLYYSYAIYVQFSSRYACIYPLLFPCLYAGKYIT